MYAHSPRTFFRAWWRSLFTSDPRPIRRNQLHSSWVFRILHHTGVILKLRFSRESYIVEGEGYRTWREGRRESPLLTRRFNTIANDGTTSHLSMALRLGCLWTVS
jgi:hypothetical protein